MLSVFPKWPTKRTRAIIVSQTVNIGYGGWYHWNHPNIEHPIKKPSKLWFHRAAKRSAGVAPEVNLRSPLHTGNKACKHEIRPRFETNCRGLQKSKTKISVAPRKEIMFYPFIKRKTIPSSTVQSGDVWEETIMERHLKSFCDARNPHNGLNYYPSLIEDTLWFLFQRYSNPPTRYISDLKHTPNVSVDLNTEVKCVCSHAIRMK